MWPADEYNGLVQNGDSVTNFKYQSQNAALLSRSQRLVALLLIGLMGIFAAAARLEAADGAAEVIAFEPVEKWANLFGGQKVTWHFQVRGLDAEPARATWALGQDARTLSRGEATITNKAGAIEVAVPLTAPPVKPGVVLPLTLTVTLVNAANAPLVTGTKRFWVFHTDPFSERIAWLKQLNLRLYDPDGRTARVLDTAKVPYTAVGNPDALTEGEPGIGIVGEGLSFEEYRTLPAAIEKAAATGHPVLCLAPTGGSLPVPGTEGAEAGPAVRLRLARADIITELDKRLDAAQWVTGPSIASSLTIGAARGQVVATVRPGAGDWNWLECGYANTHSKLIICGFGLIANWDESPTPRYLFAQLLSYLGDPQISSNNAEAIQRSQ